MSVDYRRERVPSAADFAWLKANDFTLDTRSEGRWNGLFVPAETSAFGAPAEFFDLAEAMDGTWIATKYLGGMETLEWSNAGLGFKRAKDAYMDAEIRGWGTIEHIANYENPCPDNAVFCRLYDMGFRYTGEGDWVIKLGEHVTGYLHYAGPEMTYIQWQADEPQWEGQINGGLASPPFADPIAAAVWVKLEAGNGA